MTLYDFETNTAQKKKNMAAILKFKMAAEDAFEKNGTNSGFVRKGIRMQKNRGSTSIGNFALDYITPCTTSSCTTDDAETKFHCTDLASFQPLKEGRLRTERPEYNRFFWISDSENHLLYRHWISWAVGWCLISLTWRLCMARNIGLTRHIWALELSLILFNPCSPEGFSQTYFPKGGGCCNPPSGLSILKVI